MRLLTILLFILSFAMKVNCQTVVPGGIVSGTWTASGSPYLVQGAIMIANGTTLTIEPGVRVEFQGHYKLLVMGRILAVGTPSDSIVFTANDTNNGWFGIKFEGTANTNDSSKLYFCNLSYSKATGVFPYEDGGAIYLYNFSKVRISNSRIHHCYATFNGGAIYCERSNPYIVNNKIHMNTCGAHGGGIACSGSKIINNLIEGNTSWYSGGGISSMNFNTSDDSSLIISNNIVSNNTVLFGGSIGGGGLACGAYYPISIKNNIISNNTASNTHGGGIAFSSGHPTSIISNNYIVNNSSSEGGGISVNGNQFPTISNNLISNNSASDKGGGIVLVYSEPSITNNSITNNRASLGGGITFLHSNPTINNSIIWGNSSINIGNQLYLDDEQSDPNFINCDIQGGQTAFGTNSNVFYLGTYSNNIDLNPLFNNPSFGSGTGYNGLTADWSLQSNSPCIDAGNQTGVTSTLDIAGNPRIMGSNIDIGAYEFQGPIGIKNYSSENKFTISPNPFSVSATIHAKNNLFITEVIIFDYYGKNVASIKCNNLTNIQLERNGLESGLYLLQLKSGESIIGEQKVVIID